MSYILQKSLDISDFIEISGNGLFHQMTAKLLAHINSMVHILIINILELAHALCGLYVTESAKESFPQINHIRGFVNSLPEDLFDHLVVHCHG